MRPPLCVMVLLILTTCEGVSLAQPTVADVGGDTAHGSTMVISGSGFGSKVPAAPLWWDNMDGADDGSTAFTSGELSWVVSGTLSGSVRHYSEARPRSGSSLDHYIAYRNAGWRGVPAPHVHSTKYATGGHFTYPNNNPTYDSAADYQNVVLTIDSGAADKSIWFVHFYYRVDPLWHTQYANTANNKKGCPNYGTTSFDSPNCYVSGEDEGQFLDDSMIYDWNNRFFADGYTAEDCVSNNGYAAIGGPNARYSWVGLEYRWDSPGGVREVWAYDGGPASGKVTYQTSYPEACKNTKNDTRSFSIGTYYHHCMDGHTDCGTNNDHEVGCNDCYRYFDDVYVDTTWSRVMLCNNADYVYATICEPQLPFSWSVSSISVTVNQGALPGGMAFVFVVDADNQHNPLGFAVSLTNDATPPSAPTNLVVD